MIGWPRFCIRPAAIACSRRVRAARLVRCIFPGHMVAFAVFWGETSMQRQAPRVGRFPTRPGKLKFSRHLFRAGAAAMLGLRQVVGQGAGSGGMAFAPAPASALGRLPGGMRPCLSFPTKTRKHGMPGCPCRLCPSVSVSLS